MFTPTRPSARPANSGPLTRLTTAGASLHEAGGRRALRRWGIRLAAVVVALVVLYLLLGVAVRIATTDMWFDSVQHGAVYRTMLGAQVLLFVVFAAVTGLTCGLIIVALRRLTLPLDVSAEDDTFRWLFRKYEPRVGRLIVALVIAVPAVAVGQRAAAGWQTYELWRHATPFHTSDPLFHKDASFFVMVYPFHQLVVNLLSQAITYGLWIAIIGGYWYGGWRLRRGRRKITRGYTSLLSLLAAGFLVVKAANYWLSRYALTTSTGGPVTGAGYTDRHAGLPSKYVLVVVALLGAAALIANAVFANRTRNQHRLFGRVRTLTGVVVVLVVASTLIGTGWPALVYRFREAPSAASLDLSEIAHNQKATRAAFGLDGDVTTISYPPATTATGDDLVSLAGTTAQTSLIDPNKLSPTFVNQQQLQAYYGFKSTLDISRYDLNGKTQDVAIAARELQSGSIPQPTWVKKHLVYTHGYGVVAAPTTEVDSKTQGPIYLNGGLPPAQQIPVSRPQVYFGPAFGSSSYAIVGQPAGSTTNLEFDHPAGSGSTTSAHTTYTGDGGIPIGSTLRRFLFAYRNSDPNIFFSSELNSASQLLTVRDPRARVAKVAPWLNLDGDEYPAVVDGKIVWIVDGYTTSSSYPDSQLVNFHAASKTTLTAHGASVAQPSQQINYLQNSVKAVVDAYTGKVTLYSWNQKQHPDALLKAWEGVFPGLVQPQSSIPSALLPQLRYPADLFNVQRTLLAKYHVTGAANFYSGNAFWKVPADPTTAAAQSINAGATSAASSTPLPSTYMTMAADGFGDTHFSLSSPMVTLNGQQLAAFVYVNSEPGPDYGKFTVLNLPGGSSGESPAQVQNDIESNTTITEKLTLQRGGNSKVVLGALEAIPVAGRMLYVEPVYTQSTGSTSFPILRHVIALYGNGDPSFEDKLSLAIKNAITSASGTG
ncbi:UPF0182 family protein [uncultured Jatrophihabitans sp.]|uniref:UPF0182 family protein n=1 Tax=uncultured Jatrophihabitans sp. TaxID=1610747 RepID=UPI0035CBDE05